MSGILVTAMIQNDIKIAFRNLWAHKFFTLLNVAGLALGMSACLTVILIIRDQLSFDHFHPHPERTFRILSQAYTADEGGRGKFATTPFPLGETLDNDFSVVEKSVRVVRGLYDYDATTASNLTLPISGYFTEPSFFQVFGFQLETGNAATALVEPNTIVLEKRTAARFFGDRNPMGQTLAIKGWGTFRVTGVALPPPGKTHLGFECLASASTLPAVEQGYKPEEAENKILDNWDNRWMTFNYVLLRPGKTKADLENALAIVAEKYTKTDAAGEKMHFFAQNIGKITPAPELLSNEVGFGLPWFFIWGLAAFVVLLIVFPCLNYANLAVARALARAKEVGVRKVVGARNGDVKRLFLVEAVLTSLVALAFAWVLHLGLNNFIESTVFAEMDLHGSAPISFEADAVTWVIFILFGVSVGLFAGWLPARKLAKMRPAAALRGEMGGKNGHTSRFGWRKVMTVGQFAVSLIFMIVVATLWSQLRFMTLADYGFQKENLLTFDLKGNNAQTLAAEIARDHRVTGVSAASILIAGNSLQGDQIQRERGGEKTGIHNLFTDEKYVPVMGLKLVAGENFPENAGQQREQFILLNEKAVAHFQLGTPAEAVGQTLWLNDSTPVTVRGVLRDFNFQPLKTAVEPFALRFLPKSCAVMHVRLAPGDPGPALMAIESIWKKTDPVHPFEAAFMEEKMRNAYRDIELMGGLLGFFAVLGLSLACLGLLGMVTYTVSTKVKEIGIRKVVGASVVQVTLLLSRKFLIMLGIAVVIALPVGYLLSDMILGMFAYRISAGFVILGGCAALLLVFGLLAVGTQTVRAALANPVRSLRSE
ncbi:MAG TPA: ABC transporter permease [Saprospiraceae bacterium]|nr:ABC transporter permease [Saprospiraceae bacterium]